MSDTLTPPQSARSPRRGPVVADASVLEDRLPESWKSPPALAIFAAVCGFVYWVLNHRPLWHTDLWGHLAYGRHLWLTGRLPETEPLMPLSSGVPMVNTAWLSQLAGFLAYDRLGVHALQALFALCVTASAALLLCRCYQRTRSVGWSLIGLGVFGYLNWHQFMVVRPQLAALVLFTLLVVLATGRRRRRAEWVVIPASFALWANLHGSWPIGLAVLGLLAGGRAFDLLRRSSRWSSLWHDRRLRRDVLLLELSAAAVLLNPYGIGLYGEVLSFSTHPNLAELFEWQPLNLRMMQGQALVSVALALAIAYRVTPRRISAAEVLLLVVLGAGAMWSSRMILWWAPVAALLLTVHASAAWRRGQPAAAPAARRGLWTAVAVGVAWIVFSLTPMGTRVLHGRDGRFERAVSEFTPLGAVEYLHKNPPQGQMFNTYELGDYLLWALPPGTQVFVATHAHLVPEEVWRHYLEVINASSGWEEDLNRYSVNTVVVDPFHSKGLISRLKDSDDWRVGYEDNRAVVFTRIDPLR